jgi:thiol-disulfide isomerase/thioredoxin
MPPKKIIPTKLLSKMTKSLSQKSSPPPTFSKSKKTSANIGLFLNYTLIIILVLLIVYTITYIYSIHKHTTETFQNIPGGASESGGNSKGFHIIYIYSDTCGFCKKFNPEYDSFREKLKNHPLNVKSTTKYSYNDPNVARFSGNVKAFPAVLMVDDDGNVIESFVGYRSGDNLYNQVKKSVKVV